jgi:hypothetical protein
MCKCGFYTSALNLIKRLIKTGMVLLLDEERKI